MTKEDRAALLAVLRTLESEVAYIRLAQAAPNRQRPDQASRRAARLQSALSRRNALKRILFPTSAQEASDGL